MSERSRRFCCALACLALLVGRGSIASAQEANTPTRSISGIAKTAGGKPLPYTTLFLFDLPPGEYVPNLGSQGIVVTDALGHFHWPVPPGVTVFADTAASAPPCHVLAADRSHWNFALRLAPRYDPVYGRRALVEHAVQECQTRWLRGGANARLSIVAPAEGWAAFVVRGPDGQALAAHAVQVVLADQWDSDYAGAVVYAGLTDAQGRLRMRWATGLRRLLLLAPGVGSGSTGTFEVLPDKDMTLQMPLLAPFARVSGRVSPVPGKPGAYVHVEDFDGEAFNWYDPQAAVDAQGRFTLGGVLPGEHRLALVGGQTKSEAVGVTVAPGDSIQETLTAPPAPFVIFSPKPGAPKPAVRGRVTDAAGQSVAGANVYALCSYDGGMRRYQEVLTAKTGDDGAYVIPGLPVGMGIEAVALVAARAGFPIAQGTASTPSGADTPSPSAVPADFHTDLALPNDHPGLTVQVRQNGQPAPSMLVRLTPEAGTGLFDYFYVGAARGTASEAVAKLLEPTVATDADGTARFTDLTPGLWDITAVPASQPEALDKVGRWQGGFPQATPYNISRGIIIAAGRLTTYRLNLCPPPGEVAFRVLSPDGQPPATPTVGLDYGAASSSGGSGGFITLDKNGTGKYSFERPGLWDVALRFRDTPQENSQASTEPFYEGDALTAVSHALPRTGAITVGATRHGPGRLRVRLTDQAGHSARGTVVIGDSHGSAQYAASLNAQGEAVFPDMPSESYLIRANFLPPLTPPALGCDGEPFPSDARLTGVALLVPQKATVKSDTETLVTFRPQPQGYIRGKIVTAAPDSPKNYAVYFPFYSEMPPAFHYDTKTGEFVVGPFSPGKTTLHLQRTARDARDSPAAGKDFSVAVESGRVTAVTVTPAPLPDRRILADLFPSLKGTVFLPDGTTPAWGARAALVVPENWKPIQTAQADAQGRLSVGDSWYTFDMPPNPPPGSPTAPVIVAWLPGANGAVIQPYTPGQTPPRLVLPAAVSVRGRITVAGQAVDGLTSSFRVLAAYQGKGKLNPLLSVEATAQADGTFELAGLTPGTYLVQAARDGIWLSHTQPLTVGDAPLPDVTLDIAPPGAVMLLYLTDAAGKPLANKSLHIVRPAGPLTDALWPSTLSTDAAGDLRVEGLEAGPQAISMNGQSLPFDVPLFVAGQPPTEKTLVVISSGLGIGLTP